MFDSPMDRHRRRKRSTLTWWLLIAVVLLLAALPLYRTFGPNPPIVVSKETTFVTEPLKEHGAPDYQAVLLADMMDGVTPTTNAAVPLVEAFMRVGDDWDELREEDLRLLCEKIGAEWPLDESLQIPSLYSKAMRIEALRLYRDRVTPPGGSRHRRERWFRFRFGIRRRRQYRQATRHVVLGLRIG